MSTGEKVTSVAIWGGAVTATVGLLQVMWTTKPWWVDEAPKAVTLAEEPVRVSAKHGTAYQEQEQAHAPGRPQVVLGFLDFVIIIVGFSALATGLWFKHRKSKKEVDGG